MILEDATGELTRQEMLEQWPTDFPPPKPTTLWEWLNQAFTRGLILRKAPATARPLPLLPRRKNGGMEGRPMYKFMRHNTRRQRERIETAPATRTRPPAVNTPLSPGEEPGVRGLGSEQPT